ncbi:MAG: hypothetical protein R3B70_36790 [Polyangiaceae bacterium]
MKKHARFLQIERGSDGDAEGPRSESADRARIAAVLQASPVTVPEEQRLELAPGAPAGDGAPPEWPERTPYAPEEMEIEEGEAEPMQLALDLDPPDGQPFVRCARCGGDSAVRAAVCEHCGAQLDTQEHRTFNDRVWDAQRRRSRKERAALDEMAAARQASAASAFRPLPEPGTTRPPPELMEAPGEDDGPILFALLRKLPAQKNRVLAGALVVGIPLVLSLVGGVAGWIGRVLLLGVVLLFLPRNVARRALDLWAGFRGR